MNPTFSLTDDAFVIQNYNAARPFSSFLPGIAGPLGKPMWVFYTNRGQCIASFGVRNKNAAMLEFFPANKAYALTPLHGFRTFIRVGGATSARVFEPFRLHPGKPSEQILRIRAHEIELEETLPEAGLRIRVVYFNAPHESVPVLIRDVQIENIGRKPVEFDVLDGLPEIVPFGLIEGLLKQMSRTMEAFAEVRHAEKHLPFFKLKIEPSDRPEVEWIESGFFAFTQDDRRALPVIIDPEVIFGSDTTFDIPLRYRESARLARSVRTESLTASAFSQGHARLPKGGAYRMTSYFGQTDDWEQAAAFRRRVQSEAGYATRKRRESAILVASLTEPLELHSGAKTLGAYSRQSFLDNLLRGGQPMIVSDGDRTQMFHYYSRKHGDMERDYNFFELSPTYYSQGNGNFRDVNQNRRSELFVWPGVEAGNVETFFNLIQLDGFNPLVIQFEKFYLEGDRWSALEPSFPASERKAWKDFLTQPFSPGALAERLMKLEKSDEALPRRFAQILSQSVKIQDATHGEGYWVDHWTYNLDLVENFAAVYPDRLKSLFVERKTISIFDSDHIVQPRAKKYVLRSDGHVRQMKAVVVDREKAEMIKRRSDDPNKVRSKGGVGPIFRTTLLAKVLGLLAVKAASLDPFGIGLEMEADKPGWCDALNGLPGLFGSSINETFELLRWVYFLQGHIADWLPNAGTIAVADECAELLRSVRDALALSSADDFFRTWDALGSLKERFREKTRLGVSGAESNVTAEEIRAFLDVLRDVLNRGVRKAFGPGGLCATYFINEIIEHELLPAQTASDPLAPAPPPTVKPLRFRQTPLSAFLEGPMHALRVESDPAHARRLYKAVKKSELFDTKLRMFKLNVPLRKESVEIGRNKIFSPGWLENESVFLHMAYKFMLETLRSGLSAEFFEDFRAGLVAFQKPERYGRSILENSSFIASSRFMDVRVHGMGFVARLSGATAEWLSMLFHMALGARPFLWEHDTLRFEPRPTLAKWLFARQAFDGFEKDTFGFKLFGKTWIVYHNPSRRDTFGAGGVQPMQMAVDYVDGSKKIVEGGRLSGADASALREGRISRLTIALR